MTEDFKTNLRASEDVHKILISTTSKLVGEFANDDILITHAWPEINNPNEMVQRREGPASRCFLLISTKLTELSKSPNIGDVLCSYLAVLYGKRFDNNGLLEGRGMYHVPNLTSMSTLCRHHLPHNSHKPRVDFKIDLNISECDRMSSLLTSSSLDKDFIQTFTACSKFYLRSLQNFEHDPEIAYLNLITAGEILSNFYEYNTVEILDKDTIAHLENIEANMCNGQKISKHFKKLQQGIKRKFTLAFLKLIDDDFFNYSESGNQFMKLKKENFESSIKAAYDLRSRHVHRGTQFGGWISWSSGIENAEIQAGKPIIEDKELKKIIYRAPTFVGLERIVRYALLMLAKSQGAFSYSATQQSINK